ncbi:MAG TPA: hypothetical protein VKC60_15455 [Opitutaceae bacterium]|nr:hypothetical protein [Opitutaceae bacterium]
MTTRLRVSCVTKNVQPNSYVYECIEAIGGLDAVGKMWSCPEGVAIAAIVNKKCEFYVIISRREVDIVVASYGGRKYLKTREDGFAPARLMSLPECREHCAQLNASRCSLSS